MVMLMHNTLFDNTEENDLPSITASWGRKTKKQWWFDEDEDGNDDALTAAVHTEEEAGYFSDV